MYCDMGTSMNGLIFASDAQGEGEGDHGGYGLVAREIDKKELDTVLKCGELPGLTIRRLGDYSGTANRQA